MLHVLGVLAAEDAQDEDDAHEALGDEAAADLDEDEEERLERDEEERAEEPQQPPQDRLEDDALGVRRVVDPLVAAERHDEAEDEQQHDDEHEQREQAAEDGDRTPHVCL